MTVLPYGVVPLAEVGTLLVEAGLPDAVLDPFRSAGGSLVEA